MMKDVQKEQANVPLAIDRVGIRNISVPLIVSDRAAGRQHTVAIASWVLICLRIIKERT